ncbi:hypothetical protein Mp_4g21710 [Marchantia polymorpha subsp. ruderalis]|uniref:Uncharacterized protein n=2 Tax=Marchantia polymorpha TaxID=3197 RepID=A0AAF6BCD6_MARPO|nr:hypothetical protein MARPO_0090s0051 [Marchantia polymorpha]BBN09670.1 hypothetical protein Mp_4g21710 [Marchantia polymorpha subsp. ruderalis]|eukprot:PTQ33316.1 hypothetical protein MARPO_0090s0051 [Marchantia polymorpha]
MLRTGRTILENCSQLAALCFEPPPRHLQTVRKGTRFFSSSHFWTRPTPSVPLPAAVGSCSVCFRSRMSAARAGTQHMNIYGRSPHLELAGLRHNVWDQDKLRMKYPKFDHHLRADDLVVGTGIPRISVA